MSQRFAQGLPVVWAANSDTSGVVMLAGGAFGTLLVPAELDGLTLQVETYIPDNGYYKGLASPTAFSGISLLSAAKTLATGANAFTADEIREIGAAGPVRFVLSAAPSASVAVTAMLLWKD